MRAEITSRDENGKPLSVHIDDGFCMMSGPYIEEEHGWIELMLDPYDYLVGAEPFIHEINALRREVWHLKKLQRIVLGGR